MRLSSKEPFFPPHSNPQEKNNKVKKRGGGGGGKMDCLFSKRGSSNSRVI